MMSGVLQGSVFGPLLFNVMMNDIFDIQLNGKLTLYADDMNLVYYNKHLGTETIRHYLISL